MVRTIEIILNFKNKQSIEIITQYHSFSIVIFITHSPLLILHYKLFINTKIVFLVFIDFIDL